MSKKGRETLQTGAASVEVGVEVMAVRSTRVVLDETICPAEIIICNGQISDIVPRRSRAPASGQKVLDVGDLVVMPGIIDTHVHTCEPGHAAGEGYAFATKAAAAGGVTTLVDMPLYGTGGREGSLIARTARNCLPPTTTLANLASKLQVAAGQCHVDVAFWGGLIPGNQEELISMLQAGVLGFKCSLIASGVEEESPHVSLQDLHMALNELQDRDCVLLAHAEQELGQWKPTLEPWFSTTVSGHFPGSPHSDPTEYRTFLDSRPDTMEVEAVHIIANLCLQYKVPCHILHLSSAQALPIIRDARQKGAPLTVETAPHYLILTAEGVPPGATSYKCCPPIRGKANQEQLWAALQEGLIDMVISAHTPCSPDLKLLADGDFFKAQGGIASLQFGLPLLWTSAKPRGFSLHDMVQLMCTKPASLCRLDGRKGALRPGMDADLVIWDPDKQFEVKKNMIQHKHQLTPFLGFQLHGEVLATLVRGRLVYLKGKFSPTPEGELLITQTKMPVRVSSPYY